MTSAPQTSPALFQQGLTFHRQGRLAEAKAIYEAILAATERRGVAGDRLIFARKVPGREAKALELARNRSKIAEIKRKLDANRANSPLFDSRGLARHMESAYAQAYERFLAGLPPASFRVGG